MLKDAICVLLGHKLEDNPVELNFTTKELKEYFRWPLLITIFTALIGMFYISLVFPFGVLIIVGKLLSRLFKL